MAQTDQSLHDTSQNTSRPPHEKSPTDALRYPRLTRGWRLGVTLGASFAFIVLLINISLTAWASNHASSMQNGIGTLIIGSCSTTQRYDSGLHLLINVLSTLLLGASNFTMQVLSSPTRAEVDKAHNRKHWHDIGVPNIRNLKTISRWRTALWLLLLLSSLPLHLM